MLKHIAQIYRDQILDGLEKCTEGQQNLFKCMYSHKDLEAPLEKVVKGIDEARLDWALTQVLNTLKKKKDSIEIL